MAIRRISTPDMFRSGGDYDYTHAYLQGYKIDWGRKTAAITRQSRKGADFTNLESRLNQEDLPNVALEMRPDHNPAMVLPFDEGAGVSGQKKIHQRPKMKEYWAALLDDQIGTTLVAREDRLFRDRHGTQPGAFTEESQKRHNILIVAGKRCYDFSRDDDLKVFKAKMDEAAAYLRHVRYMNDMQLKKQGRGEWTGGCIVAPYAIDKMMQARVKEYIKQQRLLGLRASDIDFTEEMSMAYRPVVYQPWLDRALDIFSKIKLFNYETPRLMRHIEEKQFIFPYPTGDDYLRYLFRNNMKRVSGGYTFRSPKALERRLASLAEHDRELAERVKKYFAEQKESKKVDQSLIMNDMLALQQQHEHLHMLLTAPGLGFSLQQLQAIGKDQQDVARKINEAKAELAKLDAQQPSAVIPRFYDILGHIPTEFWKQNLDHRRKMMRLLIDNIQIEKISPHIFVLCVSWISPVSTRSDAALLYRATIVQAKWTPEEEERLRAEYPHGEKQDILRSVPNRSWSIVTARANALGLKRTVHGKLTNDPFHREVTHNDWTKTCEYYGIFPESEEGQAVLDMLNAHASTMKKKDLAFHWLIPAEKIAVNALLEEAEGDLLSCVLEATRSGPLTARVLRQPVTTKRCRSGK